MLMAVLTVLTMEALAAFMVFFIVKILKDVLGNFNDYRRLRAFLNWARTFSSIGSTSGSGSGKNQVHTALTPLKACSRSHKGRRIGESTRVSRTVTTIVVIAALVRALIVDSCLRRNAKASMGVMVSFIVNILAEVLGKLKAYATPTGRAKRKEGA